MLNQEITTIEFKGIYVTYKIDYDLGQVSLIEKIDSCWKPKKWIFERREREVEYLNSWQNILEAMQIAIAQAKKKLEADKRAKAEVREDLIIKTLTI
jgi:hypothetical protein